MPYGLAEERSNPGVEASSRSASSEIAPTRQRARSTAMVGCDAATTLIAYSDGMQRQWLVDRSLDMSAATGAER